MALSTGFETAGAGAVAGGAIAAHGVGMGAAAAADAGWSLKKLYQLNISSTAMGDASSHTPSSEANGETSATKRGRDAHDNYHPGKGYNVDRRQNRLDDGRIPDAIDFKRGIVRELKPNNPRQRRQGIKQVKDYVELLKKAYPNKKWKWALDTYTQNPDGTFNYKFGGLNK